MTTLSACFTGPRAAKMPYDEKSIFHETLESVLKEQIIRLIRIGVSEFYTGGQTGIDTLAALLVISVKRELLTTANLHLVLPYKDMHTNFSDMQKEDFDWIKCHADTVEYLYKRYTPNCYRQRNRYMVAKSDYLIGVADTRKSYSKTHMTINMARKKRISVITINSLSFEITREPPS